MSKLLGFMEETIDYFLNKLEGIDKERYFADRDIRNILDKTINDIILCVVDISEEILKKQGRNIPDTYKDTILACHEYIGDIVFKVAPLVKHRNESIHQYLKINWQNIITVKERIPDIREFISKAKKILEQ
ncbi:MAG: HepT-like ribonuclease domain-containing protein [Thermodesulfovibrionales bacterium]